MFYIDFNDHASTLCLGQENKFAGIPNPLHKNFVHARRFCVGTKVSFMCEDFVQKRKKMDKNCVHARRFCAFLARAQKFRSRAKILCIFGSCTKILFTREDFVLAQKFRSCAKILCRKERKWTKTVFMREDFVHFWLVHKNFVHARRFCVGT